MFWNESSTHDWLTYSRGSNKRVGYNSRVDCRPTKIFNLNKRVGHQLACMAAKNSALVHFTQNYEYQIQNRVV